MNENWIDTGIEQFVDVHDLHLAVTKMEEFEDGVTKRIRWQCSCAAVGKWVRTLNSRGEKTATDKAAHGARRHCIAMVNS